MWFIYPYPLGLFGTVAIAALSQVNFLSFDGPGLLAIPFKYYHDHHQVIREWELLSVITFYHRKCFYCHLQYHFFPCVCLYIKMLYPFTFTFFTMATDPYTAKIYLSTLGMLLVFDGQVPIIGSGSSVKLRTSSRVWPKSNQFWMSRQDTSSCQKS